MESMKKTLIVIALLLTCCLALFARRTGSIMSFGYDAQIGWNSNNKIYMVTGPSLGMSSIWTYGSASESMGYFNRIDMKIDLQHMNTEGNWQSYDPSKTSRLHLFEIGGFGFNLPVGYNARVMMGLGLSFEVDYYHSSSYSSLYDLWGFGASGEFILNLTDSLSLDVGVATSYVILAYAGIDGPDYFYYGEVDSAKGFRNVSAKVSLGLSF